MQRFLLTADASSGECMDPARDALLLLKHFVDAPEVLEDLDLALTEACSNVVRHAYPKGQGGPVEVVLEVHPGDRVEVEVADRGQGFGAGQARCELPEPGSENGRGFYIMARCADRLSFHSDQGRHAVRLVRQVDAKDWKPDGPAPHDPPSHDQENT